MKLFTDADALVLLVEYINIKAIPHSLHRNVQFESSAALSRDKFYLRVK